ncbi:MAG: hypothetical protein R6T90_05110 [Dissulfuribacterales bacterium]
MKLKIWIFFISVMLLFQVPPKIFACGHITWSEETDSPPLGEDFFANNEPTLMCALGFPNLSSSEEGGLRTCMRVSYPCDGFWLSIQIVSYASDSEAQSVWNTFVGDAIIQPVLNNDYGTLLESAPGFFLVKDGTYVSENADYGSLNLWAIYQGCIIGVKRTRITAEVETPPLSTAQACWNQAYIYARDLIDRKCGVSDPCAGGRLPLPSGLQALPSGDSVSLPVFGTDINQVRPLGLGGVADNSDVDKNRVDYHIGLCPFEQPVDIYLGTIDPCTTGLYLLDEQQRPKFTLPITPLVRGASGKTDLQLSGTFGGLYGTVQPISKGVYTVYLAVTPQGGDLSDAYLLTESFGIECEGRMPVPTSQQFFSYEPGAVVVTGHDPGRIKPLAVGPCALDGDLVILHYDFCPFEGDVDVHLALYCPSDDPQNIYYLVNRPDLYGTSFHGSEDDLFEKVNIELGMKLPSRCLDDDAYFDVNQADPSVLALGNVSFLPHSPCYCMLVITPKDQRDKYYAWITYLDINLKQAIINTLNN